MPFTLVPRSKGPWVAETSPALAPEASNRATSEPAATTGWIQAAPSQDLTWPIPASTWRRWRDMGLRR